ncbi:hypothetical protein QJS04_geneDACA010259 [Acorus gramineus]|uniref:Chaperonin-like RbcX protein 2, chloroplastic n=1 Tax=Acorus gramineus TaxID=55184 RepID=A0AAV9A4E4_ACOGR|nr:hypothetical protein QJS04_geneDACA010259 [Acorus gramineus]
MVGTGSMISSIATVDSQFCVNSLSFSSVRFGGVSGPKRSRRSGSVELNSPFVSAWDGWRLRGMSKKQRRGRGVVVVGELGGQYEEGFEDVHLQVINFFTQKAVRTVLYQLYEMNPPAYTWLYNYIAQNDAKDGNRFIRRLAKERQELAERVMITRLHLYGKWIKKLDHGKMYERISNENLAIMRERLMETVIWPSDDSNTEKIG